MQFNNHTAKYKNYKICLIAFSLLLLVLSVKYVKERKQIEQTTVYLYNVEVENHLAVLSMFLGSNVDLLHWGDKVFQRDLENLFFEVNIGILNIVGEAGIKLHVPQSVLGHLYSLREKIQPFSESLHKESIPIQARHEIIKWSNQIRICELTKNSDTWEQIDLKLHCLLNK